MTIPTNTAVTPCITGKSFWVTPSTSIEPMPGMTKIRSIRIATPSSAPAIRPTTVITEISAFFRAKRK